MPPFFTRSGDDGKTGLLGPGRVPKNDPLMEALGAVDEATAALGFARSIARAEHIPTLVLEIQRDLYRLMTELAASPDQVEKFHTLGVERLEWLESRIDELTRVIPIPHEFILPGDTPAGAAFALARTIVRRAERNLVGLHQAGSSPNPVLFQYMNRLSSLCFILELLENHLAGLTSTPAKETP